MINRKTIFMMGEFGLKSRVLIFLILLMMCWESLFAQHEIKGLYIIKYEQIPNSNANQIPIDLEKKQYFVLFPITDSCFIKKHTIEFEHLEKCKSGIVILNDNHSCEFIGEYTDLKESILKNVKDSIATGLKLSKCIQKDCNKYYKCLYIEGLTQTLHENECKKDFWNMILNDYTLSTNKQQSIVFLTKITKIIPITSYADIIKDSKLYRQ